MKKNKEKSPFIYAGWVLKISFGLMFPIFAGFFLGTYLDKLLGLSPVLTLILLLSGIISGFTWLYRLSTKSSDD